MKTLKEYINEAYENNEIQDLKVVYNIEQGKDIWLYAPNQYSEDDITIYLGDVIFEDAPAGSKNASKLFGSNADKIIDVYLEYDEFKHDNSYSGDVFSEWDNKYDTKNSDEDDMGYFLLRNVRYIINFESFSLKVENQTDVDNVLNKIFKATESSSIHQWKCNITLDENKPFDYKASF